MTKLQILIIKDMVLFPHNEIRLELVDKIDKKVVNLSLSYFNKNILIICDNTDSKERTIPEQLKIGIIGTINMKLDLPNDKMRVSITGATRVKIENYQQEDDILTGIISKIIAPKLTTVEQTAYIRSITKQLEFYLSDDETTLNEIISKIMGINDLSKLTDILVKILELGIPRQIEYLNETNTIERALMLLNDINQDQQIKELEEKINDQVSKNIDDSQKEYLLKEKLKVIKEELNIDNSVDQENEKLLKRINETDLPDKTANNLREELQRLQITPPTSPEFSMIRSYIEEVLSLPWNKQTIDNKNLTEAMNVLNETHYGLNEVKEKIIEYLALIQTSGLKNSPIICFVGPPGVGKTTLAKSIATAMNRNYTKITVGGISDESEIIGHRRTYMGSSPGKIIKGLKKAGTSNPVFVIDEIDKMTKDLKGDPASALLEVLDKEQNHKFCDNYIEEEYDLSQVMFIATANYSDKIPLELYDRMEIIELASYTEYEKTHICKDYIIPKTIKNYNLIDKNITFTEKAISLIINSYTREAGVRELERIIAQILRKIITNSLLNNQEEKVQITEKEVKELLGLEKYNHHKTKYEYLIGTVNGMGYSALGGDILPIEVGYYRGKGKIITTGSLGEVFKESSMLALSYIKSNYKKLGIIYDLLDNSDIHIHVPEGAIKKDGPSAGIAITTALISAFTNKKIPSNISMTGELTLRGDILPVGGLKEKIIGAKRAGMKKIFIPYDNKNEVLSLEDNIRKNIEFKFVKNYDEIREELNLNPKN